MKRTALIFAAGLGTRLKPLTDTMPKALVPYKGVPMLESLILKLKDAGFTRIVINIHHFADMIEDFVKANDSFGMEILFSDERDLLRDTGGGLRHAGKLLSSSGPVLIHNVDIISDIDLNLFYKKAIDQNEDTVATLLVSDRKSSRHLLFEKEEETIRLKGWMNVDTGLIKSPFGISDPSDYIQMAFSGIHIVMPQIFSLIKDMPEKFPIMDFYLSIAAEYRISGIVAHDGCTIKDIGKISSFL